LTARFNLVIVAVRFSMSNMFRRLVLSALIIALVLPNVSVFAAPGRAGQPPPGAISGVARSASAEPLPNHVVRLRSAETGQLTATTTTGAAGQFSFAGLNPGTYVVEVLDGAEVIGTSAAIVLSPAAMVASGLVIQASAARAKTVALVAGGAFLTSTLGIVTMAAVGAGVVGAVVMVRNSADASASK
jgi:hypothetical protein